MLTRKSLNIYSVAEDRLKKLVLTPSEFKRVFSGIKDLEVKFYWISMLILKLKLIINTYDSKTLNRLFKTIRLNGKIYTSKANNVVIKPHRKLTVRQIRVIEYINAKILPSVLSYYANLLKELADKHNKIKTDAIIPYADIPTFNYDSRIILMFASDAIKNSIDQLIYLNQVKMQFTIDRKAGNISSGYINALKGKDMELIDLAIENIKLNQQLLSVNRNNEDVTKDCIVKNNGLKETVIIGEEIKKENDIVTISNCDKLIWLGTREQLKKLVKLLQKYSAIPFKIDEDPGCLEYMSLFIGEKGEKYSPRNPRMVVWNYKVSDLAYLIMRLENKKLISESTSKKRARCIFLDEKGKRIKDGSFRSLSVMKRNCRHKYEIDEIIKEITVDMASK